MTEEKIKQIRMYLMDSLMARAGMPINPDLITDISVEFMGRVIDILSETE